MNEYNKDMSGLIDNPRLLSTVFVGLVDKESSEVQDALYDEAAEYRDDVVNAMVSFRTQKCTTNDLMRYFTLPDDRTMEVSIKGKIQSALLTAHSEGKTLYAALDLEMSADLTEDEFEAFKGQIESQYRDGLGAEFELSDIQTSSGDIICLRLFHDDLNFYAADEFGRMIQRREVQAQEHPGMDMGMVTDNEQEYHESDSPSLCQY